MIHACSLMRRPSYTAWSCGALRRELRGNMIQFCSLVRRPSYAGWSCGALRRELSGKYDTCSFCDAYAV
eukprot:5266195-Alexandrium_andersonii.AAC.1